MANLRTSRIDEQQWKEHDYMSAGMLLSALLSDEELAQIKDDWNAIGGFKVIPWWKYVLDNVNVSYQSK